MDRVPVSSLRLHRSRSARRLGRYIYVRLKWNATLLTLFLQFDSFPKFFIGTASIFQVNR